MVLTLSLVAGMDFSITLYRATGSPVSRSADGPERVSLKTKDVLIAGGTGQVETIYKKLVRKVGRDPLIRI